MPEAKLTDAPKVMKEGEETTRVHIWLYAADIDWIDTRIDAVKRSKFIRLALRKTIRALQERADRQSAQPVRLDSKTETR